MMRLEERLLFAARMIVGPARPQFRSPGNCSRSRRGIEAFCPCVGRFGVRLVCASCATSDRARTREQLDAPPDRIGVMRTCSGAAQMRVLVVRSALVSLQLCAMACPPEEREGPDRYRTPGSLVGYCNGQAPISTQSVVISSLPTFSLFRYAPHEACKR